VSKLTAKKPTINGQPISEDDLVALKTPFLGATLLGKDGVVVVEYPAVVASDISCLEVTVRNSRPYHQVMFDRENADVAFGFEVKPTRKKLLASEVCPVSTCRVGSPRTMAAAVLSWPSKDLWRLLMSGADALCRLYSVLHWGITTGVDENSNTKFYGRG
jgi:hypothetical protein